LSKKPTARREVRVEMTMRKPLIYRDADTGQPSGGTPPPAEPPAQSAATLTQDQFNAALADEKRKWKQAQAAEVAEAARKAAEAEAATKGEFEKLANERAARLSQIEAEQATTAARVSAYENVLTAQIKARVKALPEAARSKLPEGDPLSQIAWLDAVEAAVEAAMPTAPRPPLRTPIGGTSTSTNITPSDLAANKRASGDYAL
jgi:hypothetical protein